MRINTRETYRKLIVGTILSVLVFFSISFVTVLTQINSPLHRINDYYELEIGFPFEYYHESMVDCPIPNSGWNINNLIIDSVITWILVTGLNLIMKRNK